jgi:hypothetical protein
LDEEDDEDVHDPEIHGAPSKVFFLSFLLTHKKLSLIVHFFNFL